MEKLYIIPAIADAANTKAAPITYGNKVFLYAAFSSTLPIIYFNPKIIKTITDTTLPIVVIIVIKLFPTPDNSEFENVVPVKSDTVKA